MLKCLICTSQHEPTLEVFGPLQQFFEIIMLSLNMLGKFQKSSENLKKFGYLMKLNLLRICLWKVYVEMVLFKI